MKSIILMVGLILLAGCGRSTQSTCIECANPTPIETTLIDNTVVHGRATVLVESLQQYAFIKLFNQFFMPSAYAASGSTTVTYTNAASTNFTINVASLTAGAFTGDTLSLGSVSLSTLSDNNLKVCNPGGNTKCTQAIIRAYTTGSVSGFVNTTDLYGAPVYAGSLNPASPLGLTSAGSVQVQTYTIGASTHKITVANFPSPSYNVTSDFANAGAGPYQMVFVIEYALAP